MSPLSMIFPNVNRSSEPNDNKYVTELNNKKGDGLRVYEKISDKFIYKGVLYFKKHINESYSHPTYQVKIRNGLTGEDTDLPKYFIPNTNNNPNTYYMNSDYYYLEDSNVDYTIDNSDLSLGGSNVRRRRLTKKNSLLKKGRGTRPLIKWAITK